MASRVLGVYLGDLAVRKIEADQRARPHGDGRGYLGKLWGYLSIDRSFRRLLVVESVESAFRRFSTAPPLTADIPGAAENLRGALDLLICIGVIIVR